MAICPICQEETGELLLDKKLRNKFEMKTMTPMPCEKCKKQYLENGVMLINPQTCSLVVIRNEVFKNLFEAEIPDKKIAFCEQGVIDKINQMAEEAKKREEK